MYVGGDGGTKFGLSTCKLSLGLRVAGTWGEILGRLASTALLKVEGFGREIRTGMALFDFPLFRAFSRRELQTRDFELIVSFVGEEHADTRGRLIRGRP